MEHRVVYSGMAGYGTDNGYPGKTGNRIKNANIICIIVIVIIITIIINIILIPIIVKNWGLALTSRLSQQMQEIK